MKPKPKKSRPYLVQLIELHLNAPEGSDQYKIAGESVRFRLLKKEITITDVLDACRVSESASRLPFFALAQLMSDFTHEEITAEDIARNNFEQ